MTQQIYYISNPYRGNEEGSWVQAARATTELRKRGLIVFSPVMHTHNYDERGFSLENEDWLAWDLALMEGMLQGDGGKYRIGEYCPIHQDNVLLNATQGWWCDICKKIISESQIKYEYELHYDSRLVVLLSRTAYTNFEMPAGMSFDSHGCKTEYEWAKQHHVRVLVLEDFLEGREVDL